MVQSAISTHQHESYEPTKNDNRVPTKFCAVLHWLIFSTVFGNASPLVRRETVPDLDTASFHLPRVDRPPSLCLPRANLFGCFPPATSSKGHDGPTTFVDGERRVVFWQPISEITIGYQITL